MQTTSQLLMIRPVRFGYNAETAVNNAFQTKSYEAGIQEKARSEFDAFVNLLRKNDITVTVVEDTPDPHTPDSIFPNNWVSFHEDGSVLLYPMYAANRRAERKQHVLDAIEEKFEIAKIIDLSGFEKDNIFLEGTGSMVLDRDNKVAYACLSPRTDKKVLSEFQLRTSYKPVVFDAVDSKGQPIYHTNVMMCVAEQYIVICLESIPDPAQREKLVMAIEEESGKDLITITLDQMNHFAGNMLQVKNSREERLLIMSSQAYESLTTAQKAALTLYNRILHSPLTTIESNGGGSARCMMAEIHLPLR